MKTEISLWKLEVMIWLHIPRRSFVTIRLSLYWENYKYVYITDGILIQLCHRTFVVTEYITEKIPLPNIATTLKTADTFDIIEQQKLLITIIN